MPPTSKPLWIETEEQKAMRAAFARDYAMLERISRISTYAIPVGLMIIAAVMFS